MDLEPLKVAAAILRHHGVSMCIVGEVALNYYNVPRVCHELEICVSKSSSLIAAGLLCSTGLFDPCELDGDFNNYTEYKRGIPRLRTTSWCLPQTILIFNCAFFGFESIEDVRILLPIEKGEQMLYTSKELRLSQDDMAILPFPRLAPLLKGVARRWLDTKDDIAMIAVEQLVDGMDLDEAWVQKHLEGCDAPILNVVRNRIKTKKSRIDYFMDHKITCFIFDEEEAQKVKSIPGYE
ncbi:hypothetical protein E4U43_008400 [Claviceps pusilla]|uniref:Ser/Thr protein phosphatase n=1 Tax=Claviceps pusilla TaxID=123648 RepID=A0A9P7NBW7_9HYPO|nr:hypothetical protein E4U43_008400 [Claviceps pusilla]